MNVGTYEKARTLCVSRPPFLYDLPFLTHNMLPIKDILQFSPLPPPPPNPLISLTLSLKQAFNFNFLPAKSLIRANIPT